MSLIVMEASLYTDHGVAGDVAKDQAWFNRAIMILHYKEGRKEGVRGGERERKRNGCHNKFTR
jgi:hypothetical protein